MERVGHIDLPLGYGYGPAGQAAAQMLLDLWARLDASDRRLLVAAARLSRPYAADDLAYDLGWDLETAVARQGRLVELLQDTAGAHPDAPPLFDQLGTAFSQRIDTLYVELVKHLAAMSGQQLPPPRRARSRHHNLFMYYRGPSTKTGSAETAARQVEDNATKALINVLELGEPALGYWFLERFVPQAVAEHSGPIDFYLQGGPTPDDAMGFLLGISALGQSRELAEDDTGGGSRIDAALHIRGQALVTVEVKLGPYLDRAQLRRHAKEWQVPITDDDVGHASGSGRLILARWSDLHHWARQQRERTAHQLSRLLLDELSEFLEFAGLSPAQGFRSEHFAFFSLRPNQRSADIAAEIKARLLTTWTSVVERIPADVRTALGDVHVNNLPLDASAAAAQTHWGDSTVNLTIEVTAEELQLNIVGWKEPLAQRLFAWLAPGGTIRQSTSPLELVIYRRHPRNLRAVLTQSKKPWFQRETSELAARDSLHDLAGQSLSAHLKACRTELPPASEKLAVHLRRSWPAAVAVVAGGDLADEIAPVATEFAHIARAINHDT